MTLKNNYNKTIIKCHFFKLNIKIKLRYLYLHKQLYNQNHIL